MTIDEAFDEWEGCKNKWWHGHNVYPPKHFGYADAFPQWYSADLTAMVLRDRNHPSVIMWSIGNEIDYPNDPYVHPMFETMTGNNDANKPAQERLYDPCKPNAERLTAVARELAGIVRLCDPTRPVNSALSFPELSVPTGYAAELDVVGFNYKEPLYPQTHSEHPDFVLLGTENSHSVEAWLAAKNLDYVCGQFLWTGVDFMGEARGWPVRVSHCGMLTLAGFEKPLYAQRKALWTTEPTAKLAAGVDGDVYTDVFGWNFKAGQAVTVACYTNCEQAELFLNRRSLGVKTLAEEDGCRATWQVGYEPGELRAVCMNDSREAATDVLRTCGKPAKLALTPLIDGTVAQVEITLLDDSGTICAAFDETISCKAEGAVLMGIENGDPQDLTAYTEPWRATYHGQAIVYLRLTDAGQASLTVASQGGLNETIRL